MLTLKAAATLLAGNGSDSLADIAAACGFVTSPLPLASADRATLGLGNLDGALPTTARIARGAGSLRALLLDVPAGADGSPLRDLVTHVANRLHRRAPHLSWLCLAGAREERATTPFRQLILATWTVDRSPPRIATLVVDRDGVVDSNAETLAALAASASSDSASTHARWLDLLGRESLTRRFYRALDRSVSELATSMTIANTGMRLTSDVRRTLALLCASRLLFLAFLEAKGWLDGDRGFLMRVFSACVADRGGFYQRVLRPLFFGTLNTPVSKRAPTALRFGRVPFLNGGLFSPTSLERRGMSFSDAALGMLVGELLGHYRFTAREDSSTWSEAAIDPEMLGKSFEALMAPGARHATGAYYTPQPLVARIVDDALVRALTSPYAPPDTIVALLRGEPADASVAAAVRSRLGDIRVLDPACGSGAFLVHALDVLAALAGRVGDDRRTSERRRNVLTRSIFGVDVNPTAVWLCELRLWLSVVIESDETDPHRVVPLPNLDRNVRVGDALGGGACVGTWSGRSIMRLRERYTRATGQRRRQIMRALDRAERGRALAVLGRELARVTRARIDAVSLERGRDLFGAPLEGTAGSHAMRAGLRQRARALRSQMRALTEGAALPFAFATHFADADQVGGFDLVVGNPPWVRPHAIPIVQRERLRRDFAVCRQGTWERGAQLARAGRGFAAQVDLSALFVERALDIARPGAIVALLVPAKLWRSLAGGGVRRMILDRSQILRVEDWSQAPTPFDAAAYPSLVVLRRCPVAASLADDGSHDTP